MSNNTSLKNFTSKNSADSNDGQFGLHVKANDVALYERNEAFIRYALDCAAIVVITDVKGTITYANSKFCEISGYASEELIGSNHRILKSGLHTVEFFRNMYRKVGRGHVWQGEICNKNKMGNLYWVDTTIVPRINSEGKVDSYTAIRFDITRQKQIEAELRASKNHLDELANIDALTGLANRRRFQTYLAECLEISKSQEKGISLALMDIDAFKAVNDSFGHDEGDKLLVKIAATLKTILEPAVFLARIGGDEFGIIFKNDNQAATLHCLNNMLDRLGEISIASGEGRRCSASIGLAHFPDDGDNIKTLFKAADIALYSAKSKGRNRVSVFEDSLLTRLYERISLLQNLERGLLEGQFELYYQPIIAASSNKKISYEALLRWNHPSGIILTPDQFEAALEDNRTSNMISQFVLQRVFEDAQKIVKMGITPDYIAINLINSDLQSDTFVDNFMQLAKEKNISPALFCVEITERILLSNDREIVYSALQRLHGVGVRIAFDDFGTGYAALTHLRQMPIDYVKMDRSFVHNIETSVADQAIIEGVIHISHKMGKRVVAEGIETRGQLEMLRKMGCDDLQGWLFSAAVPISKLPDAVKAIAPLLSGVDI